MVRLSSKEHRCSCSKRKDLRFVEPFSFASLQRNTKVFPPPRVDPFEKHPTRTTLFRRFFLSGDIPVTVGRPAELKYPVKRGTPVIKWLFDPNNLDYCYYLPILIDGLADSNCEYRQLAKNAVYDLILRKPHKILPVVPQLILPLKRAFNTNDPNIIVSGLKIIQKMVLMGPCVGQALVPYFRQLLPVCNQFRDVTVSLGGGIDALRNNRVGDVIMDTLEILEKCGGPDAYINIKYMVPTYESCVMN